MGDYSYSEKQYFNPWLRFLVFLTLPFIALLFFSDRPMKGPLWLLVVVVVFLGLFASGFAIIHLKVCFAPDSIRFKFAPFQRRAVVYRQDHIDTVEVVVYRSLREFGGWGIRWDVQGRKMFSMAGNNAVLIQFKNGKKILIGVKNPIAVSLYLQEHYRDKWKE